MKKSYNSNLILHIIFETPLGSFLAASHREHLVYMHFEHDSNSLIAWCDDHLPGIPVEEDATGSSPVLNETRSQVTAWLEGEKVSLDLPYTLLGTEFQKKTWESIRRIPRGETRSYSDVARDIEHPLAARAVGNACNKNPLALIIPCQRVVSATGLGGYGCSGLELKRKLLKIDKQ